MRPGDLVGGRFEVAAFVGEGGMGAVYRALDRQTGETVALKHVRATADGENRFFREARALALLSHPAIVRYVAHGTAQSGEAYLAMEWLEGRTLRSRLAEGPLDVDEVVDLARRVTGALSHAHAHGIVHRDLNPMNLLLVGGRVDGVKVLDFGLARHRGDRAETTGPMTGPIGTMGYMAPEQARGMTEIDARADLFSLGAVLFECLTGQPAFGSDNYLAVLAKIVVAPAPRVRDLAAHAPAELDALVDELLAKDPDERPPSADAVLEALASLKGSRPSLSAPSANESLALTSQERTLVSVIVCTGAERESGAAIARAVAERHRLSAEPLAGRGLVLTSSATGAATDQAARAARAALELGSTLAASRIALATGWAVVAGSSPTGSVVERAAELVRRSSDGRVRIDDVTLGLLSPRFEVTGDAGELVLVGHRDDARPARLLLGRSAGCYGRDRELRTLHALLDESVEEPMAQAILLTGPAGVGKSRVRFELLAQLPERHPALEIWVGRGDPMRAGSSFAILANALRRTLGVTETEDPGVQRRKIAARVARHVAEAERERVGEFLGELIGVGEADPKSPRLLAARQDPVMMGDQTREAVISFLEAECADHPVLVVLEDFQWGDAATVKVVDTALRQLSSLPFAVLAIARQDVHERFPNLWSERELQEIRVGALTRRAAESMVRDALPECDSAAVEQVVERAGGNAFYLEELIRAQADGRGAALPETVLGMVKERIESMEPEARRVLRAASVFGQSFHAAGVAALLGGESVRAEVDAWLHTLEQREVVTRRSEGEPSAEPAFAFRHALVRDAAHAMLTDEDRTLGHRLAAGYLSASGVRDGVLLAELYEQGGATDEALEWWHRAANDALDANDFDAALARADRGEKLCRAPADRARLELARAEALRLRGDAARAAEAIAEAVGNAPAGTAIWCNAVGERALILQRLGDAEQLASAARELAAARVEPQHDDALALARARTALALLRMGMRDEADRLAEPLRRSATLLGPLTAAHVHALEAVSALLDGELTRYLSEANTAATHYEMIGDARSALEQRISIGSVYIELGAFARAEELLREALGAATRIGVPHAVAGARHNLGLALAHLGRFDEAVELETLAREAFAETDRRLEGGAELCLAIIHRLNGDWERADAHARHAMKMLALAAPPLVPAARATLAAVCMERDAWPEATALAATAYAELEAPGKVEYGEPLIRWVHARALLREGRTELARSVLSEGHLRLREQADALADEELAGCLLRSVPDNRALIALSESLDASV